MTSRQPTGFTFPADGARIYVLLVIVANAGVFFLNIMPSYVGALIDIVGLTERGAGFVASANVYGAALGALLAVVLTKRIAWKRLMLFALVPFVLFDCLSANETAYEALITIRFASGIFGGVVVTSSYAMMARLAEPDRAYGLFMALGFALGGAGIFVLPGLLSEFGAAGVFYLMALFNLVALALLPLCPDLRPETAATKVPGKQRIESRGALLSLLLCIFLFQCANMGIFSYQQRLGLDAGLSMEWVALALSVGLWASIPGSSLVAVVGLRYGHVKPVLFGCMVMFLGIYLLHHSSFAYVYFWAGVFFALAVATTTPYLFGLSAALDSSGQAAAAASFISITGLATGPLISAWLLESIGFSGLLNLALIAIVVSAGLAIFVVRCLHLADNDNFLRRTTGQSAGDN